MCVVGFANLYEPSTAAVSISIHSDSAAANPTIDGAAATPTMDGVTTIPTIRITFKFPRVVSTWPRLYTYTCLHTYIHNNHYF